MWCICGPWVWYKLDHEAGCSLVPILLKCELHVNLNVACFILAAAVAAATTVAYMSKDSVLYHIETILIQCEWLPYCKHIKVMTSTTC